MRYFCCHAGDLSYETARQALDAAWGHPNAATNTLTCISPAVLSPRDDQGRLVLAVNDEFCEYPAAAQMLSYMLSTGDVVEITDVDYRQAIEETSP